MDKFLPFSGMKEFPYWNPFIILNPEAKYTTPGQNQIVWHQLRKMTFTKLFSLMALVEMMGFAVILLRISNILLQMFQIDFRKNIRINFDRISIYFISA